MDTAMQAPRADDPAVDPIHAVAGLLGDKWVIRILFELARGSCRFNALSRVLDGVSRRTLSATLKRIEREGLVVREVVPSNSLGVWYRLTPLGQSLLNPIRQLQRWTNDNCGELHRARAAFARIRFPLA